MTMKMIKIYTLQSSVKIKIVLWSLTQWEFTTIAPQPPSLGGTFHDHSKLQIVQTPIYTMLFSYTYSLMISLIYK
jgi:hypothetical protein